MKPVPVDDHWNCGVCGCSWNGYSLAENCDHGIIGCLCDDDENNVCPEHYISKQHVREVIMEVIQKNCVCTDEIECKSCYSIRKIYKGLRL